MFNTPVKNDINEGIDFDFFSYECEEIIHGNSKISACSKIVTKAVIETNPETHNFLEPTKSSNLTNSSLKPKSKLDSSICKKNTDCISSPSSSLEQKMLDSAVLEESLLNCLAYNDNPYQRKDSSSFSFDELDNSGSYSVSPTSSSSDFTCVSPLTCLSNSSHESDDCDVNSTLSEDVNSIGVNEGAINDSKSEKTVSKTSDTPNEEVTVSKEAFTNSPNHTEDESNECNLVGIQNESCVSEINYAYKSNDENSVQTYNSDNDYESEFEEQEDEENGFDHDSMCSQDEFNEQVDDSACCSSKATSNLSRRDSSTTNIEEDFGEISLASQNSSKSSSTKSPLCRESNKCRSRKKCNLTFNREERIRIERDNLILLKKIMAHSKPRSVTLNRSFSHKKSSTSINRAKEQKKIEQDNYVLYSKISAMSRLKKVF